jgi:hypothetical protein
MMAYAVGGVVVSYRALFDLGEYCSDTLLRESHDMVEYSFPPWSVGAICWY